MNLSALIFAWVALNFFDPSRTYDLNQHLLTYEEEFHFSSEDFQNRWNNGELGDDQIFFEWFTDLETRDRIKNPLELLEKVKLDK